MRLRKLAALVLVVAWMISILPTPVSAYDPYNPTVDPATQIWNSEIRPQFFLIPPVKASYGGVFGADAVAYYGGVQEDGYAYVSFLNSTIGQDRDYVWHEAGHAYQDAVGHALDAAGIYNYDLMAAFWSTRGFPGTYQDAIAAAQDQAQKGNFYRSWQLYPWEAWAECFKAVATGSPERTETYGIPLDAAKMRAFFQSLEDWLNLQNFSAQRREYVTHPFGVWTDSNGNAQVYVPLFGLTPYVPTLVVAQRVGLTGFEDRLPTFGVNISSDATYAIVFVNGDYVRGGEIWLQVAAVQGPNVTRPFPALVDQNGDTTKSIQIINQTPEIPTIFIASRVGLAGFEDRMPQISADVTSSSFFAITQVRGDYVHAASPSWFARARIWLQGAVFQDSTDNVSNAFPVTTDASGNANVLINLSGVNPASPYLVVVQRVGIAGFETRLPTIAVSVSSDATWAVVHVRGDYVQGSEIWLQFVVLQNSLPDLSPGLDLNMISE